MFKGINFIKGPNKSGKTIFLNEISTHLKSIGKRLCYIGNISTAQNFNQTKYLYPEKEHFDYVFDYSISINEIYLLRNFYDYIIMDNIDILYVEYLKYVDRPIIMTCLDKEDLISFNQSYTSEDIREIFNQTNYTLYEIRYGKVEKQLRKNKEYDYIITLSDGCEITKSVFLNKLKIENKINLLLNE